MDPIIQNVLIFGGFTVSMLLKDIVYTVETKADANGNTLIAAIADPLGDGLGSLTNIFTIAIVAAGLSRGGEIAQVAGNMAGGFVGVFAGSHVSLMLDKFVASYHRRPNANRIMRLVDRQAHPVVVN